MNKNTAGGQAQDAAAGVTAEPDAAGPAAPARTEGAAGDRKLKPDLSAASSFLNSLDASVSFFTFQTFDDNKKRKDGSLVRILHGSLEEHRDELAALNAKGAGIFVTVNATDGKGRESANIVRVRAVFQDDDKGWQGELPLAPSMEVQSSPGKFQRWWRVEGLSKDDFAGAMARIVKDFGGDPGAASLPQVLRLPGFYHRKGKPVLMLMIGGEGKIYAAHEILAAFGPAAAKSTRGQVKRKTQGKKLPPLLKVREALAHIPNDDADYDTWLRFGMALKQDYGERGRELWEDWSKRSAKFDARTQDLKWKSFRPREAGVSVGTIFQLAKAHGWTPPVPDWVEKLNARHAFIVVGGKPVVLHIPKDSLRVEFWTMAAFHAYYANQTLADERGRPQPVSLLWMRHPGRRHYDRIDFCPGQEEAGVFNLWRGFAVQPSQEGSCERFKAHLLGNICQGDGQLYDWLWTWLADIIQNPGRKSGICVVLRSDRHGTGKSKVGDVIRTLIGPRHSVKIGRKKELVGDFNAHFENALFAQVEEAIFAGDPSAKNVFNDLITSPAIGIERKGIDRFEVRSVTRFLVTSNAEWATAASADERRLAVFEVGDAHAEDHPYFAAFDEELNAGGYGRLMHELMTHDFKGIDPTIAPRTIGLRNQKLQSLDVFARWWLDELFEAYFWNNNFDQEVQVNAEDFRYRFAEFEQKHRHNSRPLSREEVGVRLRKLLPSAKRIRAAGLSMFERIDRGPSQPKRRPRHYELPPLNACRAEFERYIGHTIDWEEPEEPAAAGPAPEPAPGQTGTRWDRGAKPVPASPSAVPADWDGSK